MTVPGSSELRGAKKLRRAIPLAYQYEFGNRSGNSRADTLLTAI